MELLESQNNKHFYNFIHFGGVADHSERERFAASLFSFLFLGPGAPVTLSVRLSYSSPIQEVLSKPIVQEMCNNDAQTSERVSQEVLEFVKHTNKAISLIEDPFEEEQGALAVLKGLSEQGFRSEWNKISGLLKQLYPKHDLNVAFYNKEFRKVFDTEKMKKGHASSFESIKELLIEEWDGLLTKKKMNWELEIINKELELFSAKLFDQLKKLKRLRTILKPFTDQFGRMWDLSKGEWRKVQFDMLEKYASILEKDKSLQQLAELLGRMQQAEKELEEETFMNTRLVPQWKVDHADRSDLVGIHESDDLSSLLPSETALLADNNLQTVFFKKYSEKKLQTFEYEAKKMRYVEEEFEDLRNKQKEDKKGPFIICVDTSGSMHGAPENVAKAIALALMKVAIRENRKCYLVSFSTEIRTLDMSDLKDSLDEIVEFLSMSFRGGTDATPALLEALRMLEKEDFKKADVIMVSDFVIPELERGLLEKIDKAKEGATKFHSLVIGDRDDKGVIAKFDNNWFYNLNDEENNLTLVRDLSKI